MRVTQIGLLYPAPEPASPDNWSGTPGGLFEGFGSHGVEVVQIPCRLPPVVKQGVGLLYRTARRRGHVPHASPLQAAARSWALARELGRAGSVDAVLAMGTDLYRLTGVIPPTMPVATYDDGTFTLFKRHPESDVRRHHYPDRQVQRLIDRQSSACRRATVCFVSTSWAARSVVDDYGVEPGRVRVVGMGHRPRRGPSDRKDWSVPRFLFVGVDWGRKNGGAVLAAFRRLKLEHPEATLDIVGDHPQLHGDGVTGHGLLRRDDEGAQKTLNTLFARSTVFVLPSRFDPAGIAYLEAASAGMPVIATTEGGAGELLGEAAVSVDPDDAHGLLAAMRMLADGNTARNLGAAAARRAAVSNWSAVAGRMLDGLAVASPPGVEAVRKRFMLL